MKTRLLAHVVSALAWPLCRLLSAWDAADRRLASLYADPYNDSKDDLS
jgi:hypothetical protein